MDGLLTAWITLSPATLASGCMDCVSGSHKNTILQHKNTCDEYNRLSCGQEVKVDVLAEDRATIDIHPGQMSLHHRLTSHGSGPNTFDNRRIDRVVRYARPDIAQQVGEVDYAMLARGADRSRNFIHISPPKHNFDPASLALYEEIRMAQAHVMMKGAKGKTEIYA